MELGRNEVCKIFQVYKYPNMHRYRYINRIPKLVYGRHIIFYSHPYKYTSVCTGFDIKLCHYTACYIHFFSPKLLYELSYHGNTVLHHKKTFIWEKLCSCFTKIYRTSSKVCCKNFGFWKKYVAYCNFVIVIKKILYSFTFPIVIWLTRYFV